MPLPIEFQIGKLAELVDSVTPWLDRWEPRRAEPGWRVVEKVHLGYTLLELIAWTCVGIEIEVFPRTEASKLIHAIFRSLGPDYRELRDHFGEEWSGAMWRMLDIADSREIYPREFSYPVTDSVQGLYQTNLLLGMRFADDDAAQEYLMKQAFFPTEEWKDERILADTLDWARRFQQDESQAPPFWIPGYLKAIEYFGALSAMFAGVNQLDLTALKQEIYDLQRWRLNLRVGETRRRFDLATDSVISILDLLEPALLSQPAKEELQVTVARIANDFSSEPGVAIGVAGR